MRNYLVRKIRCADVYGLFANTDTGLLEDRHFRIPVENRFSPDSARQTVAALTNYFKIRQLDLVPVKIHTVKIKTVVCMCPLWKVLDISAILNEF